MNVNNALNSRTLNTYGSAMNEYMVYSKLISLIEQYNRLATVKGLPVKKVPIYTGHINEVLITRAINAILNDIDKLQSIEDRDDGPPLRYGVYDGEFSDVSDTFEIGSWKYMIGELPEGNIGLNVSVNDTTITEMPEDLPFNVITDNQGDISNLIGMASMFGNCESLTRIDLSNFNTSNITNMAGVFYNCKALTSITFGDKFNTSNVTNMSGMFTGCEALTRIDLSNFNTSIVTVMSSMFQNCTNLTSITFGDKFNTSNDTDMDDMFDGCTNLTSITLYKVSSDILAEFPVVTSITEWSVKGVPLTNAAWDDSWGDGPVTFTRTI